MNIFIFSAQYLPTVGGVERYTNSLSKKLIERGHSVTVITSALNGIPNDEIDSNNIKIIRLPVIPVMNGRFPVLKPSKGKRNFERYFAENKPDFCVIQTRFYVNSIFAAHLCKKYNVPNIVVEHGTAHLLQGGVLGFMGNIYEHLVFKYIHKYCPDIYGVSIACCEWLKHFGLHTDNVLYNAIDQKFIDNIPAASRSEFEITDDKVVLCFSARLIAEKGIYKAIEAFNMCANCNNACLVILGGGQEYDKVKSLEADNIKVLGSQPYERALGIYKMSDIFILPTDYPEGFPTAVIEASACDNYIITTNSGGNREMIVNSSYGTILEENTVDSLKSAIEIAISDAKLRKSCAENAKQRVSENFTWDKTADKLIKIAEEKIEENK